jgi:hypothetical protein
VAQRVAAAPRKKRFARKAEPDSKVRRERLRARVRPDGEPVSCMASDSQSNQDAVKFKRWGSSCAGQSVRYGANFFKENQILANGPEGPFATNRFGVSIRSFGCSSGLAGESFLWHKEIEAGSSNPKPKKLNVAFGELNIILRK